MLQKTYLKITFLFFLIFSNANAYMLENKKVSPDLLFIQVGAFSHESSLSNVRKKLKNFPLLRVKKDKLIRLYVVSNPKYKKVMFHKVKKYIPDAFVVKNRKNIFKEILKNNRSGKSGSSDNQIDLTAPLDAKAILQTRKKFF